MGKTVYPPEAILSSENFEDLITAITIKFKEKQDIAEHYKQQVKEMKEKTYKDSELQKLKKENEELKKCFSRSFIISEEEYNSIIKWIKEHEKKHSLYAGPIGGLFEYIFTPTSVGTIGKIICPHCKEEFYFKDI